MTHVKISAVQKTTMDAMIKSVEKKRSAPRQPWDQRLIQGVLANSELLRGCAPAQAAALAAQCWTLEAKRAEPIVTKGGRLPGVFALAYGIVKIALKQGKSGERVVRLVQAGQTFGEASALLGHAAPFEASAVTPCKLVVIPSAAILDLAERDPRGARQVIFTLGRRVVELLGELEASSTQRGAQRLASYLGSLPESSDGNGGCAVHLPAPKAVIASRLDMKKETLSRLLRDLSGKGLIAVHGGSITLLDRARLGELA